MNPLVSIIIPAYNAEKYLPDTLHSIIDQSYPHWELFIIDDGSKDTTATVLKPFLGDSRVNYIYQQNAGVAAARNNGLDRAKGDLLAFLDADDVMLNNNLEEKVKALLANPDLDWVYSDAYLTDAELNITETADGNDEEIHRHFLLWDRRVIQAPCSNNLMRRKCFANGLRFDAHFSTAADQDFMFYLSRHFKGKRIAKPLFYYRVLPNSMSKNIALMEKDHLAVYRKARKNGLFSSKALERNCFSRLYLILAGSWWKNGGNKWRGLRFVLLSFLTYPPTVLNKLFKGAA